MIKLSCGRNSIFFILFFILTQNIYPQQKKIMNKLPKIYLSSSQNFESSLHKRTFAKDGTNFVNSIAEALSSPFKWKTNDLYYAGGFLVFSAGTFLLDEEMRKVFLNNRNKVFDKLEPIGYAYGSPLYTIPGSILFYLTGTITDNNWIRDTGLMLTETLFVVGIIQIPTRIIFGRSRPYTENGNASFKFLKGLGQDRASFISGHAAIAFGISNILSHQIDNPLATIGLYGLASLTPLSRLYADKHWFSDIFIGTALGIFVSNAIIDFNENASSQNQKFSFIPTLNGIQFIYRIN
jgi:membrane-associated phospholipid phosphatase